MSKKATQSEIQQWLVDKVNYALPRKLEETDLDVPFLELGLTSRFILQTMQELNTWLGISVSPVALTKYPSIGKISVYLANLAGNKTPPQENNFDIKEIIAKDVVVNIKCSNKSQMPTPNIIKCSDDIIITGANAIENGFFSLYIIKELLEQGTGNIYCMVNDCENNDPKKILKNLFEKFEIYIDSCKDRLIPLNACYYKPKFGLEDSLYEELSKKVGVIIHNAADFNNLYDYSMLREKNVCSIDEVLRFANYGRYKSIHYINSIIVNLVCGNGAETLCNSLPPQLTTGYFASRIVAEIKIKNAIDNGFDINVYRHPKLLNTQYYDACASDDEFLTFVKFCLQNKVFPDFGAHRYIYLLRVTNAAKALINIIFKSETNGVVYNISNKDILNYKVLLAWLKNFDQSLKEVTIDYFNEEYLSKSNSSDDFYVFKQHFEKFNYWGLLQSNESFQQGTIIIDNTIKILGDRCYSLLNFTEADLNEVLNGLQSWLRKNN
jgi:thioester reductase-like protein